MEEDLEPSDNSNTKPNDIIKEIIINDPIIIVDEVTKKELIIKKNIIKIDKVIFQENISYENFITKDLFNSHINYSLDKNIYLNKIFFFATEHFCECHTKDYKFIEFETASTKFFHDFIKVGHFENLLGIFTKKGVGVTTYLYITFLRFRKDKQVHFLYFDLDLFEKMKTTKDILDCLYFFFIGLFINFNEYNKFCEKIFYKLKKRRVIEKEKIIFKIIKYYIKNYMDKDKTIYKPCIIIDNFRKKNYQLYDNIEKLQNRYDFSGIIIYSLDDKYSNENFYQYISRENIPTRNKINKRTFYFMNDLYDSISELPNKHKKYFINFFPSISNYIKINNIDKEEEAKKFYEEQINTVKNEIFGFYSDETSLMSMYVYQVIMLVNKELNKDCTYIQQIIYNVPLNFFIFSFTENDRIMIKYSSKIVKKIWKKFAKSSLIDSLFNFYDSKLLENYIKGGIFEKGIVKIIRENKTFFGKIDNKVKFNCILNCFKTNPEYIFKNDVELKNKIMSLKGIDELKNKYKNFQFIECFIIKQKFNGKDWDAGLVIKYSENGKIKFRLFLLQISLNKTIKQILNILAFLDRKINFIKQKIFEILGIQIDETHILFIFNSSFLSSSTSDFLKQYKIPFIYFSFKKRVFMTNDKKEIDYNLLLEKTNFIKNWNSWKSSIYYELDKEDEMEVEEEEVCVEEEKNVNEDEDVYYISRKDECNTIKDCDFSLEYFK